MAPTPTDQAEIHQTELLRRMSAALTGVEDDLQHNDRGARQAACACQLLLIGALATSRITPVAAWSCVRWHVADCLHDDSLGKDAREVYRRVLGNLDGK